MIKFELSSENQNVVDLVCITWSLRAYYYLNTFFGEAEGDINEYDLLTLSIKMYQRLEDLTSKPVFSKQLIYEVTKIIICSASIIMVKHPFLGKIT